MQRRIGRVMQFIGLAVPPLSIALQLSNTIAASDMLRMLIASVCLFTIGYILTTYSLWA
ncbi:MAG TPA: hypothetical protein VFE24_08060 [Pirellulales bacterium]|jgi:hypothetical protein|nr:hypothetical protein [Pirellulales bacterium]